MPFEELFSALGLGELLASDLFMTQVGVLAATALLFLSSLVVTVMSFRSAAASRQALLSARELAIEVRHLTAQVEKSARRPSAASEETSDYSFGDRSDSHDASARTEGDREDAATTEAMLEAAKKAATEPSALLRDRLRWR